MLYSNSKQESADKFIRFGECFVFLRAMDICINELAPRLFHDYRVRRRVYIVAAINLARWEYHRLKYE